MFGWLADDEVSRVQMYFRYKKNNLHQQLIPVVCEHINGSISTLA
jgi:hypothetical protein